MQESREKKPNFKDWKTVLKVFEKYSPEAMFESGFKAHLFPAIQGLMGHLTACQNQTGESTITGCVEKHGLTIHFMSSTSLEKNHLEITATWDFNNSSEK